jgi:hypothetical protein
MRDFAFEPKDELTYNEGFLHTRSSGRAISVRAGKVVLTSVQIIP